MFFALGASVAGLLALWVAPMVWRRAVRVTERRVEAAIPLSIHEVQADKDQMRADFAVQLRRVEQTSERLRAKAAEDRVTIEQQLSRIEALATDRRAKAEIIAELEDRSETQQMQLTQSREQVTQLRSDLNGRDARLQERSDRIKALQAAVRDHENASNTARIEAAALQTRGEDVAEKLRNAVKAARKLKDENAELKTERRDQQTAIKKLEREKQKIERENDRQRSAMIDLEERLERRKAELARLKGTPVVAKVATDKSATGKTAAGKPVSRTRKQTELTPVASNAAKTAVAGSSPAPSSASAIDKRLEDFQQRIVKLDGKAPRNATTRKSLLAEMDAIAEQITAANDSRSDANKTGEASASRASTKKLKGFKKPVPNETAATPPDPNNDKISGLSARAAGLHKLPAAE
ncbi:MAG: hypothetical protein AAGH82_07070 [Pseudomonadota bacterium]